MNICITTPQIVNPHGGMRIIFEWCFGLKRIGHKVTLFVQNKSLECNWYDLNGIHVTNDKSLAMDCDIVIIGSPHSNWVLDAIKPSQKCFIFQQMDEIKFRPYDLQWKRECVRLYRSKFPLIHGARWNEDVLRKWGRTGETHYLPNGINLSHFPIKRVEKSSNVVLLESPESNNPAKDINRLAIKAARELREMGAIIIGYGAQPPKEKVYHEFFVNPNLERLNTLYENASILLKATRFDHRALSPLESMTKGCVPVRAIIEGDDDLIDGYNCIRLKYMDYLPLAQVAEALLERPEKLNELANNCIDYVSKLSWEPIIKDLNKILTA